MTQTRKKHFAADCGITLIELLVAITITSFISLTIYKATSSASATLRQSAAEVQKNIEIMNFSRTLRYDIAGASDVFAFGAAAPIGGRSTLCTSANTPVPTGASLTSSSWDTTSASTGTPVVRPLLTIQVKDLSYNARQFPGPYAPPNSTWIDPTTNFYGYEIRREVSSISNPNPEFEIWRVVCADPASGFLTGAKRLLGLGSSVSKTFDPRGTSLLTCLTGDGVTFSSVGENSSTYACPYYSFQLPIIEDAWSSKNTRNAKLLSAISEGNRSLTFLKRRLDTVAG